MRPVVPYTLALLRSALGRSFDRWYFTYQRSSSGAVNRADGVPALWQVVLEYLSGSPPTSRLASPPAFALVAQVLRLRGRWFFTYWGVFAALSAGGVSGSALYSSASCRPVVSPELLPQADSSSFQQLCSPSQSLSIPESLKLTRKTHSTAISNRYRH